MSYFVGKDKELIESLKYDEALSPSFEMIKRCLIWQDEAPLGLSSSGYDKLCDLWIARSFIHRGIPFSDYKLDPIYFFTTWQLALQDGFNWPGFRRLELSKRDKAFYESKLKELNDIVDL